ILAEMQVAKQMQAVNASCKCLLQCLLQMLVSNASKQMLIANATANAANAANAIACSKTNAYCKCLLQ
ncbi:hypothetical protein Tco_0904770, partial [Tanacetum coccineum]